jgi:hypothetical protein
MALPEYFKRELGTAVIWGEAGASGVTATLSLDALAAAAGRMGASVDLGSVWDDEYLVQIIVESGTAPTAGGLVDLYLAASYDNSLWPAGVSGSDGAFTVANVGRLGMPVTSCVATNDANTIMRQNPVVWRPPARYVVPVVINNWSQAIRDEATATNNDSRVLLVPRRRLIQDAA